MSRTGYSPRSQARAHVVQELLSRGELGGQLGEAVPPHLERADRAPERPSLQGVLPGLVECQPRSRQGPCRADDPLPLQLPHELEEALVLFAQQRRRGNANVVQNQLGGIRGPRSQLVQRPRDVEAREVGVDQEQAEALVPGRLVRPRHQEAEVGPPAVRDEDLPAVDDPLVAVPAGRGLDGGHVGAGIGLGDPQAGDLLAADGRAQVPVLLLGAAEPLDRRGGHLGLHGHGHPNTGRPHPGHLLGQHDGVAPVAPLATDLRRVPKPEEPQVTHSLEHPVREVLVALPVEGVRSQLGLDERPHRFPKLVVLVGEQWVPGHGPKFTLG